MIKKLYKTMRSNYLKRLNAYRKKGYKIPEAPTTPKKVTSGSIRKLEALNKKLTESIREQKIESGYFTKQREAKRLKSGYYERKAIEERQKKIREANKKAANKPAPKRKLKESDTKRTVKPPKTPVPKQVRDDSMMNKPPALSDLILYKFESDWNTAKVYVAKSKPYQEAVRKAGNDADAQITGEIENIMMKYYPDLSKKEIRIEIAKKLDSNYYTYIDNLDKYLYEFESDGQGNLNHTDIALNGFYSLLDAIGTTEIDIEDKKKLEELVNALSKGETVVADDESIEDATS